MLTAGAPREDVSELFNTQEIVSRGAHLNSAAARELKQKAEQYMKELRSIELVPTG